MDELKGLMVDVLRPSYNCTNGGITSKHDRFVLVGEDMPEVFEVGNSPGLLLDRGPLGHWRAVPLYDTDPGCVGWMFGGNFIHTSDSRFHPNYPVPVHDRQETQMDYERHSA